MSTKTLNTKVLITGATGCLGLETLKYLISQGYECVGTGRNIQIGQQIIELGAHFIELDLERQSLKSLFEGVDIVVHCAALSSAWGPYEEFYQSNVVVTQRLIQQAVKSQVKRFVHISTPSIYFDFTHKYQIEEHQVPSKFVNHYAETKYLAEQEVLKYQDQIEVIGLRPRAIFGPGDRSIFPRLLRLASRGKLIQVGKGSVGDYTYVKNVAHAISLSMTAPQSSLNRFYNITNGEERHINEFVMSVFDRLGIQVKLKKISWIKIKWIAKCLETFSSLTLSKNEPLITEYGAGVLHFDQTLSLKLAEEYLGYEPIMTLDEGVKEFTEWYQHESN